MTDLDTISISTSETEQVAPTGADPRQKLVALIRWLADPDCPVPIPPMLQGLAPIWLPVWLEKVETMDPVALDRAGRQVIGLADKVLDPATSVDEFKSWLPRA